MVREDDIRIIFIDYIGLFSKENGSDYSRSEFIGKIAEDLKQLAEELNIPIVCLTQINRACGKDSTPVLADIRDSDLIEKNADTVIFLDDESKHFATVSSDKQNPNESNEVAKSRPIKIIVAKQSSGNTCDFNLKFNSCYMSFSEMSR